MTWDEWKPQAIFLLPLNCFTPPGLRSDKAWYLCLISGVWMKSRYSLWIGLCLIGGKQVFSNRTPHVLLWWFGEREIISCRSLSEIVASNNVVPMLAKQKSKDTTSVSYFSLEKRNVSSQNRVKEKKINRLTQVIVWVFFLKGLLGFLSPSLILKTCHSLCRETCSFRFRFSTLFRKGSDSTRKGSSPRTFCHEGGGGLGE